jgi:hypothetical protein
MTHHFYRNPLWHIASALLIVMTLSLTTASPALALDLNPNDYFQFNFNAVTFDKSEVTAGEAFHYTITGSADCAKDLPLPISEVTVTSQVIARPIAGGTDVVLNPSYVIDIKPLPNKAGQSFNINQTVALQFPAGSAPGNYYIMAQVTSAKVKVLIATLDVTGSFPAEGNMGTVKCVMARTALQSPTAAVTNAPAVTLPAATTTSPTTLAPTIFTSGTTSLLTIAVIGLIVVVAVLLIIIIVLLRQRRGI